MTTTEHPHALRARSASESYAAGENTPALLDEVIGATLARIAGSFPGSDALIDHAAGRRWTYRELHRDVRALAAGLVRLGVGTGDRVGLWSPNRFEWVLVQYATAEIGAILVNLNPSYRQREIEYALRQSGTSVVFAAPHRSTAKQTGPTYAEMLDTARRELPELREVVLFESAAWTQLLNEPSPADAARVTELATTLHPDDPVNIQYTSGTTGHPKGATLTHRNIGNNGYLVGELLQYTDADRIAIPVPFYHCFGMVMGILAATSHGAAMVIPGPVFNPATTLDAVVAHRCTSLYGVPTMFIAELAYLDSLDDPRYDLSTLRTGIMAGSPCPEQVMRQVVDRMNMAQVCICYGMTETSPVSTQTRVDDSLERRVTTVGRVGPHLEIAVVDPESGRRVPRGVAGEFCTRGYSVMKGYWAQEETTAEVLDADGWMHTGDLAVMDEDGYVRITGRIKDMVIRGGENIYPREIEEFLYTHPDILDAQVIGVPDERFGEELMAWILLREGVDGLTVEEVRAFAEGKIARHKIPRYVHITDEFPMTVTGKVRKVELRERAVELLRDQP